MGRGDYFSRSAPSVFRLTPQPQDVNPLSEADKVSLRAELVPAMIALSTDPADKAIRAQTAESISLIAELDFPAKWPDLIDVSLCPCLSFAVHSSISTAPDCFTVIHIVFHEYCHPSDLAFYFLSVACPCSVRYSVHGNQSGAVKIHGTLPWPLQAHRQHTFDAPAHARHVFL